MKTYKAFIFDSTTFDPQSGRIALRYSLDDDVHFTETVEIPSSPSPKLPISPTLDSALVALFVAGGVSYYKTCCPKEIAIRSGTLSPEQARFWNAVYENGLGEFFYKNQIDFRGLISFPISKDSKIPRPHDRTGQRRHGTLVPIGGGKDSLVTIEKLRREGKDITLLRMGQHPLIDKLVSVTGLPCIAVRRTLAPDLFAMNEAGALNGHIPITAYLSCLCVVVAEVYRFAEIAFSNEKSASVGNVTFLGKEINHQWSKSEEFENLFREYVRAFIDPELRYWSPLRSMTELEVVAEFARNPQYFPHFTSCNRNWKILKDSLSPEGENRNEGVRKWCNNCPKCAFAYALLAAYLPRETLQSIFGENLFSKESLIPLYKQLLGLEGFKPFECVGTPEETQEAFARIRERGEFRDSVVLRAFSENAVSHQDPAPNPR